MPLILGGQSATAAAGYSIDNSCMFNVGDSSLLTKTPAGDGNLKTFTFSSWIKRSALGYVATTVNKMADASTAEWSFYSDDTMKFYIDASNGQRPTAIFRDPSAWYHIVQAVDTTDGVAADRVKTYVNGVQQTSFAHKTNPSADTESRFNSSSYAQTISASSDSFGGYMADVCFIDGLQLAASDFGEFSEDSSNTWIPKDISGLTFGTNGYWLDFADSAALGNDVSGNNNDYAVTNLDATNQMTDTPTNNFATLNPLYRSTNTLSEGNLVVLSPVDFWKSGVASMGAANGKWYAELKCVTISSGLSAVAGTMGLTDSGAANTVAQDEPGRSGVPYGVSYSLSTGAVQVAAVTQYTATAIAVGDLLLIAMDLDNNFVYFSDNGAAWANSGDPESGATGTGGVALTAGLTYLYCGSSYKNATWSLNCGNPYYANTSSVADENGYGDFEFAPPSGYYAMCTKNLSEFG